MKLKLFFFLLIPFLGISQVQIGQDIIGKVSGDMSGDAVSLSSDGTIVAIGSQLNSDNGYRSGHVRIFENTSGVWTQQGQDINGSSPADRFGYSVSLSADGNIVAIGAINNDAAGNWIGYVRVFKNISGVWIQIGQDIDGKVNQFGQGGNSGYSVSLSGDGNIVAIGTPDMSFDYSHVRVFKNISGSWIQIGSDINADQLGDMCGYSVSISEDGTIIAIGSPYSDSNGIDSGHVKIYKDVSGVWSQIGQDIVGENAGDLSGYKVSISADGNVVAIGAPHNYGNLGHVRVFKNNADVWTQIGNDIDGQPSGINSGNSITLSADGNTLIVGSLNLFHSKVYRNISGNWAQICTIGTKQGHNFGLAISSDGMIAAIGSPAGTIGNTGVVQVYNLSTLSSNKFVLDNFSIYPNPTSNIVNISLENNLVLEKAIFYNNLGQIVKEANQEVVDVSALAKGVYFVEVTTDQGKASKKVIIK